MYTTKEEKNAFCIIILEWHSIPPLCAAKTNSQKYSVKQAKQYTYCYSCCLFDSLSLSSCVCLLKFKFLMLLISLIHDLECLVRFIIDWAHEILNTTTFIRADITHWFNINRSFWVKEKNWNRLQKAAEAISNRSYCWCLLLLWKKWFKGVWLNEEKKKQMRTRTERKIFIS